MINFFRSSSTGKRRKPILSIRARLVVLALLAVVPLMVDRVRLLESSRSQHIDDAAAEVLSLTRRGTEGQREIITTLQAVLQIMARAYITMLARGETCNLYLRDLTGNVPWIKGISIVGPEGRIKCATDTSAVGLDLSDRPHYGEALRTNGFVVSSYMIGRATGAPAIVAAFPTQAIDASVNAVIVATVELQWITGLISSLERRLGSSVLLIDGNGTLLAGDPHAARWVGKSVQDSPLVRAIADHNEGTVRAEGLDGSRRIFGFVRIPWSDARLVVGLDEADVLRRVNREILLAYLQLGFFGLLVLVIAWFGGERLIVAPIRSLARIATRLGRGDLDARADQRIWAKEFEPLAAALNDMAHKLAHREKELLAANRDLERLASIDSLSGLANRRAFDARIATVWLRSLKLGHPVALLMIDVDHFKLFNDRYGHVEGDMCLRRIGKLMKDIVRGGEDLSARYGGEEFALLLPGTNVEQALEVAERLRRSVENIRLAHADSPLGQVTISIGVAAMMPGIGENSELLVEAADAGLYAAKRRGRNTVVAHGAMRLANDAGGTETTPARRLADFAAR